MKRIKLLALLSLFVVPTLGSASFFATQQSLSNLVTTEPQDFKKNSLTNPEPVEDHYFKVGEGYYDDLESAIDAVDSGNNTIQVLKDYEADHERESVVPLTTVNINKSLTIDGVGDDGEIHEIKGQAINISGVTANFENVIINGDKYFNKGGSGDNGCLLTLESGATLNLNKHTVIKNFKFNSFCVIRLLSGSKLYINDQTEITDCAAKFGIVRLNPDEGSCPAVYMNGGKVHHNSTSNMGKSEDSFVEGLFIYVAGGQSSSSGKPAIFHMYGGEICYNTAECFDNPEICESVGLIFLHSNLIDVKIINGSIHDNLAKLGGAICYGTDVNTPRGNIEIGGSAYIYDNYGSDDEGNPFDSNIYVYRPDSDHKIVVSKDYPLTKTSKVGVFLCDSELPDPGQTKTVVYDASYNDRTHFIADNEDYTMRYEGSRTNTLGIYRYTETDPHLTEPVFNDDLHYNDHTQQLILEPGVVTKGGTLLYSQDYQGVIEEAHWTTDPTQIVGKESGDYPVAYYVTAGEGCAESLMFEQIVHIGKRLMQITWPEDSFIYDGTDQQDKLKPHYTKEGQDIDLDFKLTLEGGRTPEGGFLKVTEDPNNRYVVTAIDPEDDSLDFPKEHSKFYTMRIKEEEYIEEGKIEIEVDEETQKPTVEIKPEAGYDAWTSIVGKRLDESEDEDKDEYETAVKDFNSNKSVSDRAAPIAIYDVTMFAHVTGQAPVVVRELDEKLYISLLLPRGITKNSKFTIYRIHTNSDGIKEVEPLPHQFTQDGYVSFVTDKLSAFVIAKPKISLLWLIIILSVADVLLVGGIAYVLFFQGKKINNEQMISQDEEETTL